MMETEIAVRFLHPDGHTELTVQLPRDTRFAALPEILYARGFLEPQKAGYRFLMDGFLCGTQRTLGDYLPSGAAAASLQVFDLPKIMV
jgi:hypothetical protein